MVAKSPAELVSTANVVEIIVRAEEQVEAVPFGGSDGGIGAHSC